MLITQTLMHQLRNCYDIRSINLQPEDAFLFGKAFGSEMIEKGKKSAVIGYDRRKKSKQIYEMFIEGMISAGIDIIALGRVPTPLIQIAEFELNTDASIAITASHNPPAYHGIKLFIDKAPFSDQNLTQLVSRSLKNNFVQGNGSVKYVNFKKQYAKALENQIQIQGKFKIVLDLLNGSAADILPYISGLLNGEYYILHHKLDHTFSGVAPDPTYQPRLEKAKNLIIEKDLDFGIAFDGDMDRFTILDKKGNLLQGDVLTALFTYFMSTYKKQKIKTVWDSKSSNVFIKWAKQYSDGLISITGHSNLHKLMSEHKADIAGECSGHYLFKDHYMVSDGLYAALYMINQLEIRNLTIQQALDLLPTIWIGDPKTIKCLEEDKDTVMDKLINLLSKQGVTLDTSDGVKAYLSCGWWLIRPSRTEEVLRISLEGWTEDGLEKIKEHLSDTLTAIGIRN